MDRVGQRILPNTISIADASLDDGPARSVDWAVPVDDTGFVGFALSVGCEMDLQLDSVSMTPDGKTWSRISEEDHQAYPGDFGAQGSQGAITLHSEEHLAQSDRGVVMLCRLVLKQIASVRIEKDPAGMAFSEEGASIRISAGSFLM